MITSAAAGDVALVESLTTKASGIGYMEYVKLGQVVRLGARDTLVLTYMTSCVQETIRGGSATQKLSAKPGSDQNKSAGSAP
jgi:hypothetical protein